jgi:hypothetical protein
MKNAVMCIVPSWAQAELIVGQLASAGFARQDISVLFPEPSVTTEFAEANSTKAPEGALAGASAGGIVGGAFGFLVGLGALFIPGAGPFLAAGPILSALSGGAAGAAVLGVAGALIGMGVPEDQAQSYEQRVASGHLLISVHTANPEEQKRAERIYEAASAEHIGSNVDSRVSSPDQVTRIASQS